MMTNDKADEEDEKRRRNEIIITSCANNSVWKCVDDCEMWVCECGWGLMPIHRWDLLRPSIFFSSEKNNCNQAPRSNTHSQQQIQRKRHSSHTVDTIDSWHAKLWSTKEIVELIGMRQQNNSIKPLIPTPTHAHQTQCVFSSRGIRDIKRITLESAYLSANYSLFFL